MAQKTAPYGKIKLVNESSALDLQPNRPATTFQIKKKKTNPKWTLEKIQRFEKVSYEVKQAKIDKCDFRKELATYEDISSK